VKVHGRDGTAVVDLHEIRGLAHGRGGRVDPSRSPEWISPAGYLLGDIEVIARETFVVRRKLYEWTEALNLRNDGGSGPVDWSGALPDGRWAPLQEDLPMEAKTQESNLSTILWTAGALTIVVAIAIYMGMQ
jgi:hypothetical protein